MEHRIHNGGIRINKTHTTVEVGYTLRSREPGIQRSRQSVLATCSAAEMQMRVILYNIYRRSNIQKRTSSLIIVAPTNDVHQLL